MYDILYKCKEPRTITEIIGICNVSYSRLSELLGFMKYRNLISQVKRQHSRGIFHKTTIKGLKYIKTFEELKKVME